MSKQVNGYGRLIGTVAKNVPPLSAVPVPWGGTIFGGEQFSVRRFPVAAFTFKLHLKNTTEPKNLKKNPRARALWGKNCWGGKMFGLLRYVRYFFTICSLA